MKKFLLASALLLVLAGCGKYEVYERNVHYLTSDTLQAEKANVTERYEKARAALIRAEATGNFELIRPAEAEFKDAQKQLKVIEDEERRRARGW
ncbi:hypothetical protein [Fundidesulfovibrio agrisoli]|uniref:hypothetical protein n=1 Tax=Fundidesulfovibrio agrisoli TaxID=2922717 RepID=UPI001FAC1B8D|nr:hypothetical protein [Fundidesulfovibrio agrisoli]